jgi:adenosylcobinamide-phosphate synthase
MLASGAGALGLSLGGPLSREGGVDFRPELGEGARPDADDLQSAYYLLWRTLVVWLVLLLMLTLARWVGA